MDQLEKIYKTAEYCAQVASKMCLEFKHGDDPQSLKADKTWVTAADQNIEKKLREIIQQNHPEHFILGEEEGGSISEDEDTYTWILDPIDGTFSFVHNIPFYSSLIAVLKGKTPVIGFACLPAMNITMSAQKGKGAFINNQKYTKPKIIGAQSIEIVATADPYRFFIEKKEGLLNEFFSPNKKMRTYPDALGIYMLLNGSVRAFIDPKVEVWDVAPYHVILPEAGFAISDWLGNTQLKKGTSVSYALDSKKLPTNCHDILELVKEFA